MNRRDFFGAAAAALAAPAVLPAAEGFTFSSRPMIVSRNEPTGNVHRLPIFFFCSPCIVFAGSREEFERVMKGDFA